MLGELNFEKEKILATETGFQLDEQIWFQDCEYTVKNEIRSIFIFNSHFFGQILNVARATACLTAWILNVNDNLSTDANSWVQCGKKRWHCQMT